MDIRRQMKCGGVQLLGLLGSGPMNLSLLIQRTCRFRKRRAPSSHRPGAMTAENERMTMDHDPDPLQIPEDFRHPHSLLSSQSAPLPLW